jgi:arylsulfatase A-like enzyme
MHEPSIRIPLMVRYPKLIKAGTVKDEMVLDLDIAPTILDLAGIAPRQEMQGKSLIPLAQNAAGTWRKEWFYDYYEYPGYEDVRPHRGIRTETHKLMHYYTVDEWEMYDLSHDPEEANNLYGISEFAATEKHLKAELERLATQIPQRHPS